MAKDQSKQESEETVSSSYQHFRALMRKNWIGWRRSCCLSCLEIMIPFIFMLFLFWIRSAIKVTDVKEKIFTDATIQIFPDSSPSNSRIVSAQMVQDILSNYDNTFQVYQK